MSPSATLHGGSGPRTTNPDSSTLNVIMTQTSVQLRLLERGVAGGAALESPASQSVLSSSSRSKQ